MNDKLLIILLRGILDIGDGKRKCREWLEQLQAKQLAGISAPGEVKNPAPPTKPLAGGKS